MKLLSFLNRSYVKILGYGFLCSCLQSNLWAGTGRDIYVFEFLKFKDVEVDQAYVELFCWIPTSEFQFIKTKHGFSASYMLTITILDQQNKMVHGETYQDSVTVNTFKEIDQPHDPDLLRFIFPMAPGEFKVKLQITDLETLHSRYLSYPLNIPDFNNGHLAMSDLQLAHSIRFSNEQSELVKNNLEILPNLTHAFNAGDKFLYVYSEVYNFHYIPGEPKQFFEVTYEIKNSKEAVLKTIHRTMEKPGEAGVLSAAMPIDDLPTGEYRLFVRTKDLESGQIIEKTTRFFILNSASPEKVL